MGQLFPKFIVASILILTTSLISLLKFTPETNDYFKKLWGFQNTFQSNFHYNLSETIFIKRLRQKALPQYYSYSQACPNSDIIRPFTHECKNITSSFETSLFAISPLSLLNGQLKNLNYQSLLDFNFKGVEIGRIAENVISPLISSYLVTGNSTYLKIASSLGHTLLNSFTGPIPNPFFGINKGHFGSSDVYIEDVSSIFPIFSSLFDLTKDKEFYTSVLSFVNKIKSGIKDGKLASKYSLNTNKPIFEEKYIIPYKILSDLYKISQILPGLNTDKIIESVVPTTIIQDPLIIIDNKGAKTFSIETCLLAPILTSKYHFLNTLQEKCLQLIKNNKLPIRMKGTNVDSGNFDLISSFRFEGEILELMWKIGKTNELKNFVLNSIDKCSKNNLVSGMYNITQNKLDNILHPQFFSRWVLDPILVELGYKYDDVVLSETGNLLKIKK